LNIEHSKLRLLFWESTSRCNLACVHCRRQDIDHPSACDLSTTPAKSLIDSASRMGKPIFVFSGGEPLVRDDWEELAAHARGLGVATALATNGTLIDPSMARRIASAGFHRVAVSLDGADSRTHDAFRGVVGCFDAAIAGLRLLRASGVPTQINATIAGHNDNQLDQLYDLALSLGASALHLFLLVPVGCGVQIERSHQLSPRRYEQVLQWLCRRSGTGVPPVSFSASAAREQSEETHGQDAHATRTHGQDAHAALELRATCAPHYYRVAAQSLGQEGLQPGRSRGCLCGQSVIFVSHRGQVFPCGYLPIDCGNVMDEPLELIWERSAVLRSLRDPSKLTGKCGRCEFKTICGGCRARAFAATGDYLAAEPACEHQPGQGRRDQRL
jgi:radical SAM protein with 4Fe4S-binding SPASM domain